MTIALAAAVFGFAAVFGTAVGATVKMEFWLILGQDIALVWLAAERGNGFLSLAALVCVSFSAYGLLGPWSVLFGEGLNAMITGIYAVKEYLFVQGLAGLAVEAGFLAPAMTIHIGRRTQNQPTSMVLVMSWQPIVILLFASLGEILNFVRVGGWSALIQGKATYQSLVTDLFLTFPSENFLVIGAVASGLGIAALSAGTPRRVLRAILLHSIAAMPVVLIYALLGRRGPLAIALLCWVVAFRIRRPIRHLRPWMVVSAVLVFATFALVGMTRNAIGSALATGDWHLVWFELQDSLSTPARVVQTLSPGGGEFGAPLGNFSQCANLGSIPSTLRWSYLSSAMSLLPRYLRFGGEWQSVSYTFRNMFFPRMSLQGTIAGTGYSALLEGLANGGVAGLLTAFYLLGLFLRWQERRLRVSDTTKTIMVYVAFAASLAMFPRSDFSSILSTCFMNLAVCFVFGFLGDPRTCRAKR